MRGSSGASLTAAQERFEPVLRAAGADALTLGEQLLTLVSALDDSAALRRSLADPSREGEAKAGLVAGLLSGFDERVVDLVSGLVRSRWASDSDLADAVERLGVDAVLASAEARGVLETVEDELFRISRSLVGQREAKQVLSDISTAPERRVALVDALVGGKVDTVTQRLAQRATSSLRGGRRFVQTISWFGDVAAERRQRLVASVTSATMLTREQEQRLGAVLQRSYGKPVQLNVTVDPAIVGGMRIQVGADVVDSTVLSRLADAQRRLAG